MNHCAGLDVSLEEATICVVDEQRRIVRELRGGGAFALTALYEAAHSLVVRSKKGSSLMSWSMGIANWRGMARALVSCGPIVRRLYADRE